MIQLFFLIILIFEQTFQYGIPLFNNFDYKEHGLNKSWKPIYCYNEKQATQQSPIDVMAFQKIQKKNQTYFFANYKNTNVFANYTVNFSMFLTNSTDKDSIGQLYTQLPNTNLTKVKFNADYVFFRAPSETLVNGQQFPLEIQIYHTLQQKDQNVLYGGVSILYEIQDNVEDSFLKNIIDNNKTNTFSYNIDFSQLVDFYFEYEFDFYYGSLTQPPCSQNLFWYVLKNRKQMTQEQSNFFTNLYKGEMYSTGGNYRLINSTLQSKIELYTNY